MVKILDCTSLRNNRDEQTPTTSGRRLFACYSRIDSHLFAPICYFIPVYNTVRETLANAKDPSKCEIYENNKSKGIEITATLPISLMRILRDGPAVSLNGSPTVSPTTAAL